MGCLGLQDGLHADLVAYKRICDELLPNMYASPTHRTPTTDAVA